MKKKMLIIVISCCIIFLISCTKKSDQNYTVTETDGIKVFHNQNIPSDPNFKITTKEVFTIPGYDENAKDSLRNFIHPHDVTVDSKGNIFILDSKLSSVKKFDKNGKFIRSVAEKGAGPGELQMAWQMMVFNDTLCVTGNRQCVTFDKEDNFIKRFSLDGNALLLSMTPLNSNIFISAMELWTSKDDETYYSFRIHTRNSKYELIKNFTNNTCKYIGDKTDYGSVASPFIGRNNNIYIAKISYDDYLIDVLDLNGNVIYKIKKDYRKRPLSNEDVSDYEESRKRSVTHRDDLDSDLSAIKYKLAINMMSMFEDKNGYLLVQVPLERNKENEFDFVVDAFKDGVFINRFKMDIGKGFDYYNSDHKRWFISNRIYYQNREDNCVTVYEY
ncbi:MAG: 6-bladed beta-propeller [Candidatus Delongbacteria bacterium]|jgi:hypothetical protein|nr:6-bladed beta-propeller [Candidatus Delongbacteria bacterium]